MTPTMIQVARYTAACKQADSIRDTDSQDCEVVAGTNEGYFIYAFGKIYRFACINHAPTIAQLFLDIVAMGPVHKIA